MKRVFYSHSRFAVACVTLEFGRTLQGSSSRLWMVNSPFWNACISSLCQKWFFQQLFKHPIYSASVYRHLTLQLNLLYSQPPLVSSISSSLISRQMCIVISFPGFHFFSSWRSSRSCLNTLLLIVMLRLGCSIHRTCFKSHSLTYAGSSSGVHAHVWKALLAR
jgi:hypothetical protein